jgi:hypothetical protein
VRPKIAEDAKNGLSQRDISRKHDISQSYVNEFIATEGLKAFKKEKAQAAATSEQKERQRVRVDRLYRAVLAGENGGLSIVMDDESYFPLLHSDLPGNQYYYASARGGAPDESRLSPRKKFCPRVLVWLAISDQGTSGIFFCRSHTMN